MATNKKSRDKTTIKVSRELHEKVYGQSRRFGMRLFDFTETFMGRTVKEIERADSLESVLRFRVR